MQSIKRQENNEELSAHLAKVERGLRQIEAGEVSSHKEAKRRLAKWLKQ